MSEYIGQNSAVPIVLDLLWSIDTHEHLKTWMAESGTVTVTAITPTPVSHINKITVKVTNALMKPGFYTPSQGTGTFVLNGTGSFGL